MPCPFCDVTAGRAHPPGDAVHRERGLLFHGSLDPRPVAGWMVIAPERHVEGWDALTPAEAEALGDLIRRAVAAIRVVTGAPRVYVAVFAEVVPHLHVHLLPRGESVPASDRGPRYLFDLAPRASAEAVAAAAQELIFGLTSGK